LLRRSSRVLTSTEALNDARGQGGCGERSPPREQDVVAAALRQHSRFLYVNPRKLELDEPLSVAEQVVDG
jgi:hypothetical protein